MISSIRSCEDILSCLYLLLNAVRRVEILEKALDSYFLFFLSSLEGSLKFFRAVEWSDRKFQNLGRVIGKYCDWGVSVLNGDYFFWKEEGRSIHVI